MKKILLIVLASIMVLGFAASAFAIHAEIPSETQAVVAGGSTQITLGGELRFRGWYLDERGTARQDSTTTTTNWADTDNDGVIDAGEPIISTTSSTSTGFTMYLPTNRNSVVTALTTRRMDTNDGTIHGIVSSTSHNTTESDSDSWYDARVRLTLKAQVTPNTTGYVALESNTGTTSDVYAWGSLNNKQSDLNILEAWILHTGSGLLGIPSGIKIGHMPLYLGEKQFLDLSKFGSDAIVLFGDPIKGMHVGLLTAKCVEGTTSVQQDDIDAYVALMTYKINDKNMIGFNYTLIEGKDLTALGSLPALGISSLNKWSLRLHNFEAHANGSAGPLTYRGEVDYQLGRVKMPNNSRIDIGAYALFAELGLKLDPVTLSARYGFASGDKERGDKIEEFQTVLGNDIHHTFIYEYLIDGAATAQLIPSGSTTPYKNRGLANTEMFSIGAKMSPAKDVTVSLDGYYLRAKRAQSGQKVGTTSTATPASNNIGFEADLRVGYKIDKNLTYGLIAGYFQPGDYYEDAYDMAELGMRTRPVKAVMHSLTLSF